MAPLQPIRGRDMDNFTDIRETFMLDSGRKVRKMEQAYGSIAQEKVIVALGMMENLKVMESLLLKVTFIPLRKSIQR